MSQRFDMSRPEQRDRARTAAAAAARRGDLVVMPLETSYGIGADAFSLNGTAALRGAKRRGRDLVLPVLVGKPIAAEGLMLGLDAPIRALIEAFWPGPLTIIGRAQPTLAWDLGDTDGAVALRMPIHPVAIDVLCEVGPMAVATANAGSTPPATTCAGAMEQFGGLASIYLDAGPSPAGEPSSVIDATGESLVLVREGAYSLDVLQSVVPSILP